MTMQCIRDRQRETDGRTRRQTDGDQGLMLNPHARRRYNSVKFEDTITVSFISYDRDSRKFVTLTFTFSLHFLYKAIICSLLFSFIMRFRLTARRLNFNPTDLACLNKSSDNAIYQFVYLL